MAITASVAGVIVWSVQQSARISAMEHAVLVMDTRIESIDAHGSRTLPIAEARIAAIDTRLTETTIGLGARLSEMLHSLGIMQQSLNDELRRLDRIEEDTRRDAVMTRRNQDTGSPPAPWGGAPH